MVELRRGWRPFSTMASAGGAGRGGGKRDGGKGEGSLARRAWRQYLLQLQQHPLRTKVFAFAHVFRFCSFFRKQGGFLKWVGLVGCRPQMITAGCLAGVSDSVAQKLSGYQKIEKRRLLLKMVRTLTLHLVSATYRCSHRGNWVFPCSFIGGNRSFSYIRLGPVDCDILICNVFAIP